MHISRRAAAVGAAAVLTGLASLGAAGAAFAAPAAHAGVQVLRLHTVFVPPAVVNHAGHGGPGDVTAVVFDLQTPGGAEAGKAYISCTTATPSVALCHAAYVLKGGQIDVQVAHAFAATKETLAITGGTGIYRNAGGEATLVEFGPATGRLTLYILRFSPGG